MYEQSPKRSSCYSKWDHSFNMPRHAPDEGLVGVYCDALDYGDL